ncbi:MAG: AAA family ATPase, partial [Patescibacteria group bacterium]|nr:AAA family ATPase [Patescibacteria group bacterium]
MNQAQALKILQSGQNVFLTGSAGSGKTYLLNQFIKYLKERKIKVGVTASTGIAATHLGGRTIHSWANIGIKREMSDKSIERMAKNEEFRKKIEETKVLIIDEISMFDAQKLDLVDRICKVIREPFLPFGGIQIVMSGDFFQLPPIEYDEECCFAYESIVWRNLDIKTCYLDEQFRQEDLKFIGILNKIRRNEAGQEELDLLRTRLYKLVNYHANPTKIYTHNIDIDAINDYELSRIPEKELIYHMAHHGPKDLVDFLKKSCLASEKLKLKKGAIVMFVKNNFNGGYVNGTFGKIIDFDSDNNYPVVETKSGNKIIA